MTTPPPSRDVATPRFEAVIGLDTTVQVGASYDPASDEMLICLGSTVVLRCADGVLARIRDAIDERIGRPPAGGDEVVVCACCREQLPADDVALRLYVERQGLRVAEATTS